MPRSPGPGWRGLADAPIRAKVSLAPGVILLVLVLLSAVSLRLLDTAEARLEAISQRAFPTYQRAAETKDAVDAIQTALQHTLSVAANESDAARVQAVAAPVRQAIAGAGAALDRLRQQIGDGDATVAAVGKSFAAYQAAASDVLEAAASDPATATMLMADVDQQFASLSAQLNGFKNRADTASQAMTRDAIAQAGSQRLWLLSGLIVALAISVGIMIATSRAIGRPIVGLTGRMTAMADDDLDHAIPALDRALPRLKCSQVSTRCLI
jgi:nitrogen fixation/metabolism regulation signal transduction histidine kinase